MEGAGSVTLTRLTNRIYVVLNLQEAYGTGQYKHHYCMSP